MKTLYLIRGLPGSGKSTLARTLVDEYSHFEADQFFMVNGKYCYDKEKIGDAHKHCQILTRHAMEDSFTPIAVSNTFVKHWEMEYYYGIAQAYGYRVVEITMSGKLYGNIHNVPEEVIQRMKENWEK